MRKRKKHVQNHFTFSDKTLLTPHKILFADIAIWSEANVVRVIDYKDAVVRSGIYILHRTAAAASWDVVYWCATAIISRRRGVGLI